jgi:hypothetical protein
MLRPSGVAARTQLPRLDYLDLGPKAPDIADCPASWRDAMLPSEHTALISSFEGTLSVANMGS